jgi:hypothetical protein
MGYSLQIHRAGYAFRASIAVEFTDDFPSMPRTRQCTTHRTAVSASGVLRILLWFYFSLVRKPKNTSGRGTTPRLEKTSKFFSDR